MFLKLEQLANLWELWSYVFLLSVTPQFGLYDFMPFSKGMLRCHIIFLTLDLINASKGT